MIKTNVKINTSGIEQTVTNAANKAQFILDQQVLKDSNSYAPMDKGDLIDSGVTNSRIGEGEIAWQTPYARRLYYNPQYNFSKDSNPSAQGLWFEMAKAKNVDGWKKIVDQAIKKNL